MSNQPEPWRVVSHSWSDTSIYCGDKQIALLSIADEATEEAQERLEAEMEERARLMAAAPELLAALKQLTRFCCRPGDDDRHDDGYDLGMRMAREAMRKATENQS